MNNNFSQNQLDAIMRLAGQKFGQDPNSIKEKIEKGQLNQLGINPQQQQQLSELLKNPQAMQNFINQPQIKSIVDGLLKGK